MKKQAFTQQLVVSAFLIAMQIILAKPLSITLPFMKIGFGFIPVMILAVLFGPIWTGACYALADFLGAIMFPVGGAFFPGFTASAFIAGAAFGIILHNKPVTAKRVLAASLAVTLLITLGLNTYWLSLFMGKGVLAIIPTRLVQAVIMIAVQTILFPLVWEKIATRIPYVKLNYHTA